jgi:DNA-3-methyladenine glycosylase
MFGPPGTFYVYFVSGMHWMLNVVTGPIGYPAAMLIRGIEGIDGPGRVTKAMAINGSLNGKQANKATGLWFTQGRQLGESQIICSTRIGVGYAGAWAK